MNRSVFVIAAVVALSLALTPSLKADEAADLYRDITSRVPEGKDLEHWQAHYANLQAGSDAAGKNKYKFDLVREAMRTTTGRQEIDAKEIQHWVDHFNNVGAVQWRCDLRRNAGLDQDNPVLRDYLGKAAKKGLAKRHSEATAWHSEKKEDKKQWAELRNPFNGQVIGKTLIAEWTEESESWIWLDDPDKTLTIDIANFELKDGILLFGMTAKGKARGKVWGKIPNLVAADVGMSTNVEIAIEGKARIQDAKFVEVDISKLDGSLSDLRFNNDLLRQVQGLVKDCANEYLKQKNNDLKKDMKKAIEDFRP